MSKPSEVLMVTAGSFNAPSEEQGGGHKKGRGKSREPSNLRSELGGCGDSFSQDGAENGRR